MREVYVILLGAMVYAGCGNEPALRGKPVSTRLQYFNYKAIAAAIADYGEVDGKRIGIGAVWSEQYMRFEK